MLLLKFCVRIVYLISNDDIIYKVAALFWCFEGYRHLPWDVMSHDIMSQTLIFQLQIWSFINVIAVQQQCITALQFVKSSSWTFSRSAAMFWILLQSFVFLCKKNHCAKLPLNCATELGDVVVNSLFRVKLLSEQSHWRVSVHLS